MVTATPLQATIVATSQTSMRLQPACISARSSAIPVSSSATRRSTCSTVAGRSTSRAGKCDGISATASSSATVR